ncbi:MAG: MFS transporter [Fibrobacterota bacterium]
MWNKDPEKSLRPDQINEHNQITDGRILHDARKKIGIGNVLYSAEENSFGALTTVIIRHLGGDAFHLGVFGATMGIWNLFSWSGTLLLKKFNSNRKSMVAALIIAAFIALLMAGSILLPSFFASFRPFSLWSYIILGILFTAIGGTLKNIEASWIGDMVPEERRGWFSSYKWIIFVVTSVAFGFLFSRIGDLWPNSRTYAGCYGIFLISFLLVIPLFRTVADRTPRNANFFKSRADPHERLNYRSIAFWYYISHCAIYTGGRSLLFAFSAAYLLDQFHFSLTKMTVVGLGGPIASIFVLFYFGRITDKRGNRVPWIVVVFILATSMFLWVSTAWLGYVPVIIYSILSSLGWANGSMLLTNLALELFPDKGRSGYLAVSSFITGIVGIASVVGAGAFMRHMQGWHYELWGATLNNYHLLFILSTAFTYLSLVPLLLIGKRKVLE